jgi:hypothetical protein
MRWRRIQAVAILGLLIAIGGGPTGFAGELVVKDRSGSAIRWSEWLSEHGPVAVLVWASWVPDGVESLERVDELRGVCTRKDLALVVMGVQEDFESASSSLERAGVLWLHDRHGSFLKEYRVIRVPWLVVIDADGAVVGRVEPTAAALEAWER